MSISTNPLHLLITATLLSAATATNSSNPNATVYEMLPKFGLPSGLLPSSVTSYTYTPSTGQFQVQLTKPCYIQFDYLVYYDRVITGNLKYGSIADLKGIQVQKFFLWLSVDEIRVDLPPSDFIYFQVGIVNKKLDVSQFKSVRDCKSKSLVGCDGDQWSEQLIEPVAILKEAGMLMTE